MKTRDARLVWDNLHGIICIYKPPLMSPIVARKLVLKNVAKELNELDCRPPRVYVNISGDTTKPLNVDIHPSYADNPLTIGPRYIPKEMKASFVHYISSISSGVCVLGINQGSKTAFWMKKCNPVSTYHITGQLGIQTNNKAWTGDIVYRCSCHHIKKHHIDKVVSAIESLSQKSLFTLMGVHPQSQEAYDLLSQGLFRPVDDRWPVIYSINCIEMNLPYFTLEVVTANQKENHLLNIVDNIAVRLRNAAITTSIRCIRCGYFTLEDALLKKHWTLQNIIDNMRRCKKILNNNKDFSEFLQSKAVEDETNYVEDVDEMSIDEDMEEQKLNTR